MAKTITGTKFLDLLGSDKSSFQEQRFEELEDTVLRMGNAYALAMADALDRSDAVSSGRGADSLRATELTVTPGKIEISVEGLSYLEFIDKGVNGWKVDKGGKYQFKTKGIDPKGAMVKSVMDWLKREKSFSSSGYKAITPKESSRLRIKDPNIQRAISASYMIKRNGIRPVNFIEDATEEITRTFASDLAAALKYDIITNLTA
jgi:hypothetical protein